MERENSIPLYFWGHLLLQTGKQNHSEPSDPVPEFRRCLLKTAEPFSICLLPDCYNVVLHRLGESLPRGPPFPRGFQSLMMRSWDGIAAGEVRTQRGPLTVPREQGQAIAASGLLLIAGVIQVMLLRVLGARWYLTIGLGGDWPQCVAGGGQVVSPQPGRCRNGAVMDRADSFPRSATVAGLSVGNLWHGETGLARSCISFFSVRKQRDGKTFSATASGGLCWQIASCLPLNARHKTSASVYCIKSQD